MEGTADIIWGTPIVQVTNPDHPRIKEGLVRCSYEAERNATTPIASGVAPLGKSGLFESPFNFFAAQIPEILALREFCARALLETVGHLAQRLQPPRTLVAPGGSISIDLYESWVHITREGGYHDTHAHANCSWCGIYYIDIGNSTNRPPNGANRFFPPFTLQYIDLGTRAYGPDVFQPAPADGKLILFPSYVNHSAVPYHGGRDRIVAAFNARIVEPRPE